MNSQKSFVRRSSASTNNKHNVFHLIMEVHEKGELYYIVAPLRNPQAKQKVPASCWKKLNSQLGISPFEPKVKKPYNLKNVDTGKKITTSTVVDFLMVEKGLYTIVTQNTVYIVFKCEEDEF